MTRRTYTQRKRGDTAEATRRRIVEATFDLHGEQGVAATSMKQIAARAGVSVGSVYHHFPTYDDAITACGGLLLERNPPVDPAILDGLADWRARVRTLVAAQYAGHARLPMLEIARADRHFSPKLDEFVAHEAAHRRALAAAALAPRAPNEREVAMLAAMLDIGVWRALTDTGFGTAEAAALITAQVTAWLDRQDP